MEISEIVHLLVGGNSASRRFHQKDIVSKNRLSITAGLYSCPSLNHTNHSSDDERLYLPIFPASHPAPPDKGDTGGYPASDKQRFHLPIFHPSTRCSPILKIPIILQILLQTRYRLTPHIHHRNLTNLIAHEISQNRFLTLLQLRFPVNFKEPKNSVIFCGIYCFTTAFIKRIRHFLYLRFCLFSGCFLSSVGWQLFQNRFRGLNVVLFLPMFDDPL